MKFVIQMMAVLVVSWLLQEFFPWWSMAVGAFLMGMLFGESGIRSFFAGFIGVGLLWLLTALYMHLSTDSILTAKVAQLFPLQSVPFLFLMTTLTGALVGGLASLSGALITYKERFKW